MTDADMQPASAIDTYLSRCLEEVEKTKLPFDAADRLRWRHLAQRLDAAGYRLRPVDNEPSERRLFSIFASRNARDIVLGVGAMATAIAAIASALFRRSLVTVPDASRIDATIRRERPRSILAIVDEKDIETIEKLATGDLSVGFVMGTTQAQTLDRLMKLVLYRASHNTLNDVFIAPETHEPEIIEDDTGLHTFQGAIDVPTLRRALTTGARILGLCAHSDGYSGNLIDGILCARAGADISERPISCFAGPLCARTETAFADEFEDGKLLPAARFRAELFLNFICCGVRLHGPLGSIGGLGQRVMDNPDIGQVVTSVGAVQTSSLTLLRSFMALYSGLDLGTLTKCLNAEMREMAAGSTFYVLLGDPLCKPVPIAGRAVDQGWRVERLRTVSAFGYVVNDVAWEFHQLKLPLGALMGAARETYLCTATSPSTRIASVGKDQAEARRARLETLLARLDFLSTFFNGLRLIKKGTAADSIAPLLFQIAEAQQTIRSACHELGEFERLVVTPADFEAAMARAYETCAALAQPILACLADHTREAGSTLVHAWFDNYDARPHVLKTIKCPHCGSSASLQIRRSLNHPGDLRRFDQCLHCANFFDGPADADFSLQVSARELEAGSEVRAVLQSSTERIDGTVCLLEPFPRRLGQEFERAAFDGNTADFRLQVSPQCPPGYATVTAFAVAAAALVVLRCRVLVR